MFVLINFSLIAVAEARPHRSKALSRVKKCVYETIHCEIQLTSAHCDKTNSDLWNLVGPCLIIMTSHDGVPILTE